MLPFMLFSTLFSSIFTEPGEQQWVCNSSDLSVWYTYCDNMKFPISISINPCLEMKGSHGYLHLSYIPRRDMKNLYFNLYLSYNSINFPMRKEVICRGSDDSYSFCRALKGADSMGPELRTFCFKKHRRYQETLESLRIKFRRWIQKYHSPSREYDSLRGYTGVLQKPSPGILKKYSFV